MIKDVVKLFDNPDHALTTRMISLALRHGTKINYIIEQIQKGKEADLFSFAKCISRVLKLYIEDGEKVCSEKMCPQCYSENSLIYREGCISCTCGWSRCS